MAESRSVVNLVLIVALCVALIVGAQGLAAASAPSNVQLSESRVIGQAGFAYLGGLRVMLAGLLYERLDPQFHQYILDRRIQDRIDLLPSIRLIQALNPQLEQPYYYVSYILFRRGRVNDAVALAKQGVANNPQSGLLRANYVQLLMVQNRKANLAEMLRQTRIGLSKDATFSSIDDQFESYGIFRTTYTLAGDQQMVQELKAEQKRLAAEGATDDSSTGSGLRGLLNKWANSATSDD